MRTTLITVLISLSVACRAPSTPSTPSAAPYQIVPTLGLGAITTGTGPDDIRRIYGPENVVDQNVDVGEGQTEPGAILFPTDPTRRAEITWSVSTPTRAATIRIRHPKSIWKTPEGIGIGTSLAELERLNGKPFTLAGFGWDYAGTVTSWNDGKLKPFEKGPRIFLRLMPAAEADDNAPRGDKDFASDFPPMRAAKPTVYEIVVDFSVE